MSNKRLKHNNQTALSIEIDPSLDTPLLPAPVPLYNDNTTPIGAITLLNKHDGKIEEQDMVTTITHSAHQVDYKPYTLNPQTNPKRPLISTSGEDDDIQGDVGMMATVKGMKVKVKVAKTTILPQNDASVDSNAPKKVQFNPNTEIKESNSIDVNRQCGVNVKGRSHKERVSVKGSSQDVKLKNAIDKKTQQTNDINNDNLMTSAKSKSAAGLVFPVDELNNNIRRMLSNGAKLHKLNKKSLSTGSISGDDGINSDVYGSSSQRNHIDGVNDGDTSNNSKDEKNTSLKKAGEDNNINDNDSMTDMQQIRVSRSVGLYMSTVLKYLTKEILNLAAGVLSIEQVNKLQRLKNEINENGKIEQNREVYKVKKDDEKVLVAGQKNDLGKEVKTSKNKTSKNKVNNLNEMGSNSAVSTGPDVIDNNQGPVMAEVALKRAANCNKKVVVKVNDKNDQGVTNTDENNHNNNQNGVNNDGESGDAKLDAVTARRIKDAVGKAMMEALLASFASGDGFINNMIQSGDCSDDEDNNSQQDADDNEDDDSEQDQHMTNTNDSDDGDDSTSDDNSDDDYYDDNDDDIGIDLTQMSDFITPKIPQITPEILKFIFSNDEELGDVFSNVVQDSDDDYEDESSDHI